VPEPLNEVPKKKKKSKKQLEETESVVEPPQPVAEVKEKSKKKNKKGSESNDLPPQSLQKAPAVTGEPATSRGANAVYSTNVISIPSHVAQKMSSMSIDGFKSANVANIVGYGLTEDIEIKIVQTKIGDSSNNNDKYSLYNMDRLTTRQRVNPRKIMSTIKKTKKSIQVI